MRALAQTFLVACAACELAPAFFVGESKTNSLTAPINYQHSPLAAAALSAERQAGVEVDHGSAVDRENSAINVVRAPGDGKSEQTQDSDKVFVQKTDKEEEHCIVKQCCSEQDTLEQVGAGAPGEKCCSEQDTLVQVGVGAPGEPEAPFVRVVTSWAYVQGMPVVYQPPLQGTPIFYQTRLQGTPVVYQTRNIPQRPAEHMESVEVRVVKYPSNIVTCSQRDSASEKKTEVDRDALIEFCKEMVTELAADDSKFKQIAASQGKETVATILNALGIIDNMVAIHSNYLKKTETSDWFGPREDESKHFAKDFKELMGDPESKKAVQELLVNIDRILPTYLAHQAGQLASQEMHRTALELANLAKHAPDHSAIAEMLQQSGKKLVGWADIDASVHAGSNSHLMAAGGLCTVKCAKKVALQKMVSLASYFSSVSQNAAMLCTDFCKSDKEASANGRYQLSHTGRYHLNQAILPLTDIAQMYVEDCKDIGCTGEPGAVLERVTDFVKKMTVILDEWLSYKFFDDRPIVPEKSQDRVKVVLQQCRAHMPSIAIIIQRALPDFLALWYEKTIEDDGSIEVAWQPDATYIKKQLESYLMVTPWDPLNIIFKVKGVNDIYKELAEAFPAPETA